MGLFVANIINYNGENMKKLNEREKLYHGVARRAADLPWNVDTIKAEALYCNIV